MASLEWDQQAPIRDPHRIRQILAQEGILYEHWGVKDLPELADTQVLAAYADEIARLKQQKGYVHADLVALHPHTPQLDKICEKFSQEHHHREDEVRFVVAGEGVFEIFDRSQKRSFRVLTQPGDLIAIPAERRHLFYLTALKQIRCIRLFQDAAGWEAIYPRQEHAL